MQHGNFDDFWKARNLRPHLKNISPAVMTVGGWFDAENLFGALETYKNVEAHSPGATNILVMGPWRHGGWARNDGGSLGPIAFFSKTSGFYREHIELPFFQYSLEGQGLSHSRRPGFRKPAPTSGRSIPWPPRNLKSRSLFLQGQGGL